MEISFQAKPISLNKAEYTKLQLIKSKFVDIVCHSSSDEDAVASAKAMKWYLEKNNIPSRIISDGAGKTFDYKTGDTLDISSHKLPSSPEDTALCVDFSEYTRVSSSVKQFIQNSKHLLCLDHHHGPTQILDNENIYIDLSAKSCCGVILRLFEALKVKLPMEVKRTLYCGMADDLRKNKYLIFSDKSVLPRKTEEFMLDGNTKSLYEKLERELPKDEQEKVMKHLNVLLSLNQDEIKFKEDLPNRMKYNSNKKFGYVTIPIDDKEWLSLGGDNKRTSSILSNFRVRTLENFPNIDAVAVFYPNSSGYRISMHSKGNNVLKLFDHIRKSFPEFSGGGHEERGGGGNFSLNPEKSIEWMNSIIKGAQDFYKDM